MVSVGQDFINNIYKVLLTCPVSPVTILEHFCKTFILNFPYISFPCITLSQSPVQNKFNFPFRDNAVEESDLSLAEDHQRLPLEEAFGDEVSGDAVPAPAPQRAPAPIAESNADRMSAVEELVEALARPFTVSNFILSRYNTGHDIWS